MNPMHLEWLGKLKIEDHFQPGRGEYHSLTADLSLVRRVL
jgi:hypothetical protein